MVIRKILISLIVLCTAGCAATVAEQTEKTAVPEMDKPPVLRPLLPPPPPVVKQEELKEDLLQGVYVTLDAAEETLSSILYMVATEAGLNLIISPEIDSSKPFTISVTDMPARDALDVITENTGVHYKVEGSSLKISRYVTETFRFPYMRSATNQSSVIGGDVFSSAGASLKGDYTLEYRNEAEINDVQGQIMYGLHALIFPDQKRQFADGDVRGVLEESSDKPSDVRTASGYFQDAEGYLFNRFTGILKVSTTPVKMKLVKSYLDDVLSELGKQVLIEAKLVEVVLNDSSAYGINWEGTADGARGSLSLGTDGGASALAGGLTPVGVIASSGLNRWFAFMASFGRVESMGNPRIRVMNGHSAMISSGQLIPYWEMDRRYDEDNDISTFSYSRLTVLDGVVMGVTPHIKEDGSITINIVPVFSDVEGEKIQYNEQGEVVASYPVINLKEAGTVLNVSSGDTIIMGGLISNVETVQEDKVPLLGDIPLLGYIFKGKSTVVEKRELVIFLTTTIIGG